MRQLSLLRFGQWALATALAVASVAPCAAASADSNLLENGGFENPLPAPSGSALGLPAGWSTYQWGPTASNYVTDREAGAGRMGSIALRARNVDAAAYAGSYIHCDLKPGTYELSVWARAPKGEMARVRVYLASAYSRVFTIGDQWQQVHFTCSLAQAVKSAEINVQNYSGAAGVVWFDDAILRLVPGVKYVRAKDRRPSRPRTLMFGPINVNYLKDTAKDWADRGFGGFLFEQVMGEWHSDVWAADKNPKTRGSDDKLFQEVSAANKACRAAGIDSNFIKVAFYAELPDTFDDAAWKQVTENFRQGARFARMSGCAGMAVDTEYVAHQYEPSWKGYAGSLHKLPELKSKIRERWRTVVAGMVKEFPGLVLLTLPEGVRLYGELYNDMFDGMLEAMSNAKAVGGVHVLTELSYSTTDTAGLASFSADLQDQILETIPAALRPYWKQRCSIALGAWPFGYYRDVTDKDGKFLGYSGRVETFGDKIVGSYADKSARYSPAEFATQMTGLNSFCNRYNWIYSHGSVFVHWTAAQQAHYEKMTHQSFSNVMLPIAPNLGEYYKSIRSPGYVVAQPAKSP